MARRKKKSFDLALDSETGKGVAVVLLFFMSFFLLLAMFDLAGAFGHSLSDGVSYVFGWDKLVVPFLLMAWAYHILAPDRLPLKFSNAVGFLLFFISLNPLIHAISFPDAKIVADGALMSAGGKLGEIVGIPLINMMGLAGSMAVLTALLVVSVLLSFNATLKQILFFFDVILKGVMNAFRVVMMPFRAFSDSRARAAEAAMIQQSQSPMIAKADEPSMAAAPDEEEAEEGDSDQEEDEEDILGEPVAKKVVVKAKRKQARIEIPFELLERRDQRPTSGDIVHNREVIRRTLETFGIPVEMAEVAVGPTVTQFALKPSEGVKLSRINGLHNDLALALAAHPIRIEAPIPGKSLVGIEVPNQSVATVGLREMLEAKEFRERKTALSFVLGRDVAGKPWIGDLARMPHLLVAGATGSGKSVCLNIIIMSYLYALGPDDVKFIMVDPKRVELQIYNGIPQLLTPVITKVPETVNALKWALREMDKRYDLLAKHGVRDLLTYNAKVQDRLPYIVVLIDELADLMTQAAADVEGPIVRLAQMSRAVGIHLVLATQRPSVDVITGLIKANIPGRIAFAVASATDSRTILDQQGAEKLLGRGDMLYSTAELSMPKRIQGAFVSETEIQRVVEYVKSKYEPADYDLSVTSRPSAGPTIFGDDGLPSEDSDEMIPAAKEEIIRAGKASASLLQRRLKVGYARAARLLDLLEEEGFIGPGSGAKPRELLQADFLKDQAPPEIPSEEDDLDESDTAI